jgi:hypothetical protein
MLSADFWWLSPEEARQYGYIALFHQEPYSDEPNTDREPLACTMLSSERRYPLEDICQWKAKFKNINVFRSFALYYSDTDGEEIIGPFLLDIDRPGEQKDWGYIADLDRALKDTCLLVKEYCSNLGREDYRIFFSGHKGFHIEIRPEAINIPLNVNRRQHFENIRKDINTRFEDSTRFGDPFIDKNHDHVRLHDSINSWIDYSGRIVYSMNFELSIKDLSSLSAQDISAQAKMLACR